MSGPGDPEAFAHLAGDEAAVVAYWSLWHPPGPVRTKAVLTTPVITGATVEAVLSEAARWPRPVVSPVIAGAAANPNVDPSHGEEWLRGVDSNIALAAAANPALFAVAADLRRADRLDPHVASSILRNPAAPGEYLRRYRSDSLLYAALHPNLPTELVEEFAARPTDRPGVHANPSLGEVTRRRALHSNDAAVRSWAQANPNTTVAELIDAAADTNRVLAAEARLRIEHRRFRSDPDTAQLHHVRELGQRRWHPRLAATVAALDDTTREAAAALIAAHFDGTIAELLDCAHSITADRRS